MQCLFMEMTETLESAWVRIHVDTSVAKLPEYSEKEPKSVCTVVDFRILDQEVQFFQAHFYDILVKVFAF